VAGSGDCIGAGEAAGGEAGVVSLFCCALAAKVNALKTTPASNRLRGDA
jgi:hypothetical protein